MPSLNIAPSSQGPLRGITVVELGHSVAAPYAGQVLADLGARVIKVENPQAGDYARGWGPPYWGGAATIFTALNRGKESVTVDFSVAEEAARLRKLIVDEADAVIQNLRPNLLSKFGLGAEDLMSLKPSLIWCDIGAFGSVGPMKEKPGYDPLVQASAGIMSITGEADRPPVRVGVSIVDMGTALWAVIGLLAALVGRRGDGAGRNIGTSLYETGVAWMTVPLAGYLATGELRKPQGSGSAEIVPYQVFATATGAVMIAAGNDRLFAKLVAALGIADLADNAELRTNAGRVKHRDLVINTIMAVLADRPLEDVCAALDHAGVPNSPLLDVAGVADSEQTKALGMLTPCAEDTLPLVGTPITFDGVRYRSDSKAPGLGQHNPDHWPAGISAPAD
ncbi:CaiB/BaiF CoA transferase family protein [Aquibium pacificus]|mgnify:CR=1 FL=1